MSTTEPVESEHTPLADEGPLRLAPVDGEPTYQLSEAGHLEGNREPCSIKELFTWLRSISPRLPRSLPANEEKLQEHFGPFVSRAKTKALVEAFRSGLDLQDRTEPASLQGLGIADPVALLSDKKILATNAAAALKKGLEGLRDLYGKRADDCFNVFRTDFLNRLLPFFQNRQNISGYEDAQIQELATQARFAMIRATPSGLRDEDTAVASYDSLGGSEDKSAGNSSRGEKREIQALSAQQLAAAAEKRAADAQTRAEKRKQALLSGTESFRAFKERAANSEEGVTSNYVEPELSEAQTVKAEAITTKRTWLEETRPTKAHKVFKFGRKEGFKREKNEDEFRDKVYAFSEGLSKWAENEVMLLMKEDQGFDKLVLNPDVVEYRAQKVAAEHEKLQKAQRKQVKIIRAVLKTVGNTLMDRPDAEMSSGERQRLNILCATGMDQIRFN